MFRCRGAPKRAGFLSSECSHGFSAKVALSLLFFTQPLATGGSGSGGDEDNSGVGLNGNRDGGEDDNGDDGDTSNNCAPGDDSTAPDDENVVRTKSTPCIGSASDARSKLPHLQDQTFADCFLVCDCLQHDGFCEGVYHNQTPSGKLMIELVSRQAVRDILTPRH